MDVLAIAEAAMRHSIAAVDTVSNNVANAGSIGFKRELPVQTGFASVLEAGANRTENKPALDLSAGALQFTGTPLHFAIEGDGWFQLRSPQGVVLTRDGSFAVNAEGLLVSKQGWPVMLDGSGNLQGSPPTLKGRNELWANGERVGEFQLVAAAASQIEPAGSGVFRLVGSAASAEKATVRQGYLESSNVDTLAEMVTLIESMRHAEAAQRAMRAYDDAVQSALTTLGEF